MNDELNKNKNPFEDEIERTTLVFDSGSRPFRIICDTFLEVEGASEEKIYSILCKNLLRMCNAKCVAFASSKPDDFLKLEIVTTERETGLSFLEEKPGIIRKIPDGLFRTFKDNEIIDCSASRACLLSLFPEAFTEEIKSERNVERYALASIREGEIVAIGYMQLYPGYKLAMKGVLIHFLNMIGIILQRMNYLKSLAESEEKYRLSIEYIPLHLCEVDKEGNIILWNKFSEKMLGYSVDEAVKKLKIYKLHESPSHADEVHKIASETGMYNDEINLVHKDGTVFPVHLIVIPKKDKDGNVVCYYRFGEDITVRKRAEEEIYKSRETFRKLIENTPVGIIVTNDKSEIIDINPSALEIFQRQRGEMIGKNPENFFAGAKDGTFVIKSGMSETDKKEVFVTRASGEKIPVIKSADSIELDGEACVMETLIDISDWKRAEEKADYRLNFERLITSISTSFIDMRNEDIDNEIQEALTQIGRFTGVDRSYVFLFRDKGAVMDNLYEWCAGGIVSQKDRLMGVDTGKFGWIVGKLKKDEIVYVDDISELPAEAKNEQDEFRAEGIKSLINVILKVAGTPLGILGFDSVKEQRKWTDDEITLLKIVGEIFTNALERCKKERELKASYEKLRNGMESTINAMGSIVEVRDPYTAGHERRVAQLASAIASEMGLSDREIEGIRIASSIHDVGKIYVPAEILNKPAKISDIEYKIIKTHPRVGYDILKNIEFPWPVADIVLQHHERFDGSGYPFGLSGKNILMGARIIGVADVVETMSSHRPYRSAPGIDKALEEISGNRGNLYDPDVVDACLRLFREKNFMFK
ncbi:PAS domain S-box protein [bacterium]|jgi:HD-GYP domain-containing protein (c-di-GMP phosphodiesterase class II)|nr:PAS domain S-box protein [bacterium]